MTKKGGGTGESNFNRKKKNILGRVSKVKRNQRFQKGTFNTHAAPLPSQVVTSKKERREQRKLELKQAKKQKKATIRAQKETEMNVEQ